MFEIYLEDCSHFCDDKTYRMTIDVVFDRSSLETLIGESDLGSYEKMQLREQIVTRNPYGGATHSELAYFIKEWIGDYIEKYIDSFHIENKDLKYIFRYAQKKKSIGVTFLIDKEKLRYLALKHPEFYDKIRPNQLVQETHQ